MTIQGAATQKRARGGRMPIEAAFAMVADVVRKQDPGRDVEAALRAWEQYLDKPLKIGEVQKRLGVKSPTTIHKWVRLGRFPNATKENGQLRIPASDVAAFKQAAIAAEARTMEPIGAMIEFEGDPLDLI